MYRGMLRGPQNEHPESTNPDKPALLLLCIAEQPPIEIRHIGGQAVFGRHHKSTVPPMLFGRMQEVDPRGRDVHYSLQTNAIFSCYTK